MAERDRSPEIGRKVPDFIGIGAMKSGTTTLHNDLAPQTPLYMPRKEPRCLVGQESSVDDICKCYEDLFVKARAPGTLIGEISPQYAMAPDIPEIPQRALEVCGPHLKIIYLVRNPIKRSISHYKHLFEQRRINLGFGEAYQQLGILRNYSLYAMQLAHWLQEFAKESILVIKFEDYVADRSQTLKQIGSFLGVPLDVKALTSEQNQNQSGEKSLLVSKIRKLDRFRVYRRLIRPLFPSSIRRTIKRALPFGQPAKVAQDFLKRDDLSRMIDDYQEDSEQLAAMLGWPSPIWDHSKVLQELAPGSS